MHAPSSYFYKSVFHALLKTNLFLHSSVVQSVWETNLSSGFAF